VALELAEDRRDRVAGERDLAGGIEAIDRLDEPERRDLHQVVERLVGALVAARQLARQRQEALGELLARRRVAGLQPHEQLAVLGLALRTSRCRARAALGQGRSPHVCPSNVRVCCPMSGTQHRGRRWLVRVRRKNAA
jgi:hypothetical protein